MKKERNKITKNLYAYIPVLYLSTLLCFFSFTFFSYFVPFLLHLRLFFEPLFLLFIRFVVVFSVTMLHICVLVCVCARAKNKEMEYSMKSSRADSRVRVWRCSDVSGTNSVPIFRVL